MNRTQYVLVTGGLGFIGSHVVVQLLNANIKVVVYDNLSNSNIEIINKITSICVDSNLDPNDVFVFIKGDIRDATCLDKTFFTYPIFATMHFAALKSVNESQKYPELYYDVNVIGTKILLDVMSKHNCKNFIYSSSSTVYNKSEKPMTETSGVGIDLACNYGKNKYEIEKYLSDNYNKMFIDWNIVILRYFNPIGAHPSGLIGENPNGVPNNIFPYLLRIAKSAHNAQNNNEQINVDSCKIFTVFGNDYNTRDGTCIRDYVHVQDVARAHVEVLNAKMLNTLDNNLYVYNIGTGSGSTVLELVNALNVLLIAKNMPAINYCFGPRRDGDVAISYALVDKIHKDIGFKTEFNLQKMCEDGLTFILTSN